MKTALVAQEKHEFALFVESLSLLTHTKNSGNNLILCDENLFHRMHTVLRLRSDDTCIFFDRNVYAVVTIVACVNKRISVTIQSLHTTSICLPKIVFLLPVLKRDDCQAALYSLAEIGVNTIQLVFTQKTSHQWSRHDSERAQRIIISAAEQSKNFAYPELKEPVVLEVALKENKGVAATKLFFDPAGKKLFDIMQMVHTQQPCSVIMLIGPEGDLSLEEKKMVQENNFIFCALTPTVVRAVQAAALSAGFIRSLLVSTTP